MRPLSREPIGGNSLLQGGSPEPGTSSTTATLITSGPMLCRLCLWTDAEWELLPESQRPAQHTHSEGLGWIGAVPVAGLN